MIDLVRTHEGVGDRAKAYAIRTRGWELAHLRTYAKSLVLITFLNMQGSFTIPCCFGTDFHYCFIKYLVGLFSCLSNVLQSLSLCIY